MWRFVCKPTRIFRESVSVILLFALCWHFHLHPGIWFELRDIRGASADLPENQDVNPRHLSLYTFRGNTAHSNNDAGMSTYAPGYCPPTEALFEGISSYHNSFGLFIHGTCRETVRDAFFGYNQEGVLYFGKQPYLSCSKQPQLQLHRILFLFFYQSFVGPSWPIPHSTQEMAMTIVFIIQPFSADAAKSVLNSHSSLDPHRFKYCPPRSLGTLKIVPAMHC